MGRPELSTAPNSEEPGKGRARNCPLGLVLTEVTGHSSQNCYCQMEVPHLGQFAPLLTALPSPHPGGTFGNVWAHFGPSHLGMGIRYWRLEGGGQGAAKPFIVHKTASSDEE